MMKPLILIGSSHCKFVLKAAECVVCQFLDVLDMPEIVCKEVLSTKSKV